MRNVCLVTNYNYARYLEQCLASITAQGRMFDCIIVVDDGSSDDSQAIIESFSSCRDNVVAILKKNGGQLSCFHAALTHIEPDDFVFFMDADDYYPADYLERVAPMVARENADFIFVNPLPFRDGQAPPQTACLGPEESYLFSSTSALTRKTQCWIGAATSCLALRGSLCHALLPYPHEKDWVTRADDVLIYGSSIAGARKLYIPSLGVGYRVHGANNFSGRELSAGERADWRLRHERLFNWYADKSGVPLRAKVKNALHEATLIPKALRRQFGIPALPVLFLYDQLLLLPMVRLLVRDSVKVR